MKYKITLKHPDSVAPVGEGLVVEDEFTIAASSMDTALNMAASIIESEVYTSPGRGEYRFEVTIRTEGFQP